MKRNERVFEHTLAVGGAPVDLFLDKSDRRRRWERRKARLGGREGWSD